MREIPRKTPNLSTMDDKDKIIYQIRGISIGAMRDGLGGYFGIVCWEEGGWEGGSRRRKACIKRAKRLGLTRS